MNCFSVRVCHGNGHGIGTSQMLPASVRRAAASEAHVAQVVTKHRPDLRSRLPLKLRLLAKHRRSCTTVLISKLTSLPEACFWPSPGLWSSHCFCLLKGCNEALQTKSSYLCDEPAPPCYPNSISTARAVRLSDTSNASFTYSRHLLGSSTSAPSASGAPSLGFQRDCGLRSIWSTFLVRGDAQTCTHARTGRVLSRRLLETDAFIEHSRFFISRRS